MKRHRRRESYDRFIALPHWMLKSAAWRTMSPNAKAILIHIWERHNGQNNGAISYSVREAGDIGLSRMQASRALQDLTERGFLVATRQSAFNLKTKEARLWRITAEGADGSPATKEFMSWKADPRSHQRDHEMQNTVPPIGQTVPPVGPSPAKRKKITRYSPTSGTVRAIL
jgi:hypothetical protein